MPTKRTKRLREGLDLLKEKAAKRWKEAKPNETSAEIQKDLEKVAIGLQRNKKSGLTRDSQLILDRAERKARAVSLRKQVDQDDEKAEREEMGQEDKPPPKVVGAFEKEDRPEPAKKHKVDANEKFEQELKQKEAQLKEERERDKFEIELKRKEEQLKHERERDKIEFELRQKEEAAKEELRKIKEQAILAQKERNQARQKTNFTKMERERLEKEEKEKLDKEMQQRGIVEKEPEETKDSLTPDFEAQLKQKEYELQQERRQHKEEMIRMKKQQEQERRKKGKEKEKSLGEQRDMAFEDYNQKQIVMEEEKARKQQENLGIVEHQERQDMAAEESSTRVFLADEQEQKKQQEFQQKMVEMGENEQMGEQEEGQRMMREEERTRAIDKIKNRGAGANPYGYKTGSEDTHRRRKMVEEFKNILQRYDDAPIEETVETVTTGEVAVDAPSNTVTDSETGATVTQLALDNAGGGPINPAGDVSGEKIGDQSVKPGEDSAVVGDEHGQTTNVTDQLLTGVDTKGNDASQVGNETVATGNEKNENSIGGKVIDQLEHAPGINNDDALAIASQAQETEADTGGLPVSNSNDMNQQLVEAGQPGGQPPGGEKQTEEQLAEENKEQLAMSASEQEAMRLSADIDAIADNILKSIENNREIASQYSLHIDGFDIIPPPEKPAPTILDLVDENTSQDNIKDLEEKKPKTEAPVAQPDGGPPDDEPPDDEGDEPMPDAEDEGDDQSDTYSRDSARVMGYYNPRNSSDYIAFTMAATMAELEFSNQVGELGRYRHRTLDGLMRERLLNWQEMEGRLQEYHNLHGPDRDKWVEDTRREIKKQVNKEKEENDGIRLCASLRAINEQNQLNMDKSLGLFTRENANKKFLYPSLVDRNTRNVIEYAKNAKGNFLVDPETGGPIMTSSWAVERDDAQRLREQRAVVDGMVYKKPYYPVFGKACKQFFSKAEYCQLARMMDSQGVPYPETILASPKRIGIKLQKLFAKLQRPLRLPPMDPQVSPKQTLLELQTLESAFAQYSTSAIYPYPNSLDKDLAEKQELENFESAVQTLQKITMGQLLQKLAQHKAEQQTQDQGKTIEQGFGESKQEQATPLFQPFTQNDKNFESFGKKHYPQNPANDPTIAGPKVFNQTEPNDINPLEQSQIESRFLFSNPLVGVTGDPVQAAGETGIAGRALAPTTQNSWAYANQDTHIMDDVLPKPDYKGDFGAIKQKGVYV